MIILITILVYFAALMAFSRITSRMATNETFYRGNRHSPWYMVAFGMVGASISGVTFVSVPGMVMSTNMTYIQTCLGFIIGYFAIAFLLLPVYYRLNLTTIYTYLQRRLGQKAYKTGASFFLLSKMTGAAVRFYVVCFILQRFVLGPLGVPFVATVVCMVALIWLYTRRGGIKTLVWTDTFQTTCMFLALLLIIYNVTVELGMSPVEAVKAVAADSHSRIFVFDDWVSKQNFWKQFVSGIFIVIVMTGLDQDMMQRNLSCATPRDSQKNIVLSSILQTVVILMFLFLGAMLYIFAERTGIALPAESDNVFATVATSDGMPLVVGILFVLGLISSTYSAAGSALTALTTSFTIDILDGGKRFDERRLTRVRKCVHIGMAAAMFAVICALYRLNNTNAIDAVYTLVSYTYGPILGMFAFGILTKRRVRDRWVFAAAIVAPVLCYILQTNSERWFNGYTFSYELLIVNAALTFTGMLLLTKKTADRNNR